jgi:PAS domain S-box-containing protein
MTRDPGLLDRILMSPDLRILAVMVAGIAIFGIVDGSMWRTLLTPTLAYRSAILFGLTLVFGWRGFIWSQLLFFISFGAFLGIPGAVFVTPMYLLSHALGLISAQRLARNQAWLSRESSTVAFLVGAVLAPAIPALLGYPVLRIVGISVGPKLPAAVDSWLRGTAGILALGPAMLVFCSGPLKRWAGLSSDPEGQNQISARDVLAFGAEIVVWTATLWLSVVFKARYGLNMSYVTFLGPLTFTLFRGMGFAALTLATNAVIATTLCYQLHWANYISPADLRLLIAIYSVAILVLATVVDERKRGRVEVARLLTAEAALRESEERLRKSEERLRLATKATNDAIWDIDLKAGIVSWNDTYSEAYGRSESDSSWQFWIDRIHPEDRARTVDDFKTAHSGDASSWNCEYRFRRADGEWAHIHDRAYIARDAAGNAWRVIGSMQDLTEQKKVDAELRESEERFRRVFEEGPLGLALVGKDYRFLKVNNALCRMVGYTEAELIQKSFAEITHPDDVRTDVELAARVFRRDIPFYRLQKRYVKKSGEILWFNLTASIILGPDGQPLHGLAMVEDITEIKRGQEEALFRQKLESVGTLAGGIAHDFNNLLGAVQAQAELALGELEAGASCEEELKTICGVAMRGSEIVRQLMIYAGKDDAVDGPVDLSKTVDEMLSLLKVSITKHAMIKADLDENLPPIRANAAQIRQIVMNLITNASDAIHGRDGVIRVVTRRVILAEAAGNPSGTLAESNYVQLEVSDTGCGMSSETQAKVFDPFFTTKSAGRGLGLAVVQGIVRSLGGAIDLSSEPDKGATFRILLRAEATAASSNHAGTADVKMAAPSQQGTILVVEDEDYLRQAIVRMLQRNGFEALAAGDGTAAIDLLRSEGARIDLVLLDMTIPGISSHEVVVEAGHAKPSIKVILTSAYSQEAIARAMSHPQVRTFIRKPFQMGDLVKTLRSSLSS